MWLSEALASPQARRGREGRCRGSQPGARSSLDGAAASPLQLPVACLSYFKKSKVPDNREGLFWMWSLDSMECYITSVVTQPCNYTQHRLGLLIKEPLVESSSSTIKIHYLSLLKVAQQINLGRKPWAGGKKTHSFQCDHSGGKNRVVLTKMQCVYS